MHGDFSRWFGKVPRNQVGILAQEGRILLDADVNAHTLLGARWQDLAARAAFGARIAAIPADNIDAWKVISALDTQGTIALGLLPGIAWADGLLVELEGVPTKPVSRTATWLGAKPQDAGAAGTRDAVILEVWRRSLNGYQSTLDLIEPALGGPDTAERVETAYGLRLYRMAAGETCRMLDLNDVLDQRGKLTVTIAPTTMTSGDCPVVEGGGYTGLEHDLYRIEIADVASGAASFKWSQWNGGLVGRGSYDATTKKLALRAGDQAILRSGLTSFYLEALVFDTNAGHWRVAYGVPATLDLASGELDLSAATVFGAPVDPGAVTNPSDPTDPTWFFRLWNGIRPIADFPPGAAKELRDGIRLEFAGSAYVAGDYWTFPVRAGLDNPPTLLNAAAPFGVHHHRVPLAEVRWSGNGVAIEDCRVPLHPITATDGCCTHSVGDGVLSHGEFTTIQAAVDALPASGGRVCVLPGTYTENVKVHYRRNVEIVGCGPRSRLVAAPAPGEFNAALPAIHVLDTSGIKIEKLQVEAGYKGLAILLEEDAAAGSVGIEWNQPTIPWLEDMRVGDCTVLADNGPGIDVRGGRRSEITHNHVSCPNNVSSWSLITVETVECRIERNVAIVTIDEPGEYTALGGIWLRGGCIDIDVFDNEIVGGSGHGIMLGHAEQSTIPAGARGIHALAVRPGVRFGYVFNDILAADCVGCGPGIVVFPVPPSAAEPPWIAGDPLAEIRIHRNDIRSMGLAGIGVIGFFLNPKFGVIAVDRFEISENRLVDNLLRGVGEAPGFPMTFGFGVISLADASDLTIRDNEIRDNGRRNEFISSGICVFHGAGVEVSRNRIYDNGRPLSQAGLAAVSTGIMLYNLMPPLEGEANTAGRLSASVHDNEIHQRGPGLAMIGVGHFSIVANAFTAQHVGTAFTQVLNVSISNQSTATGFALPTFAGLRDRTLATLKPQVSFRVGNRTVALDDISDAEIAGARMVMRPVLAAASLTPPGSIIFADNHVITNGGESDLNYAVLINALCDVTVSGNHFLSQLTDDHYIPPVLIAGMATHVHNNRFIDPDRPVSVSTWGYTNITTHNTADHCIDVHATVAAIASPNIEGMGQGLCLRFSNLVGTVTGVNHT
ncbi:MAG: right-handed parallel beta-helix repeat-containing protein [Kofleriaceae bacterium]